MYSFLKFNLIEKCIVQGYLYNVNPLSLRSKESSSWPASPPRRLNILKAFLLLGIDNTFLYTYILTEKGSEFPHKICIKEMDFA